VTQLLKIEDVPDYSAGYQDWAAHCGGVDTIAVGNVVDVDDIAFNAGLGCKVHEK
jgi:hypothetical protein